jgi:transcriptional regulator of NAD metabolism
MRVNLSVSTKQQIGQLIARIRTGKTVELMHITGGYHYHTVRAENEEVLNRIELTLTEKGYIAPGI